MPPYPRRSRQGLKRFSPELVRRDLELLLAPGTVAGRVASNHLARTTQITDEDLERLGEVFKPGTSNLISEVIRALRSSTNQPPSVVLHPLVNKHWDKVFKPGLVAGLNSLLARVATPSDAEGAFNRAQFIMQSGREAAQFKMARELFLFAAERKHPGAQMALGRIYSEGIGVEKNDAEAFQWYLQAAKLEAPHAGCRVADLYAAGRGVLQNIEQATEWYEREARLGCSRSQYMCGRLCESARPAEALAWYREAATNGLAAAQTALGDRLTEGIVVQQDNAEAYLWYGLAAEYGDRVAAATARGLRQKLNAEQLEGAESEVRRLQTLQKKNQNQSD